MTELQQIIKQAWADRAALNPGIAPARIGDNCFVGARSEIVEGVIVKRVDAQPRANTAINELLRD